MWPKVVGSRRTSKLASSACLRSTGWGLGGQSDLLPHCTGEETGPRERDRLALSHLCQLSWNWAVANSLSKVFLILFLLSLAWHSFSTHPTPHPQGLCLGEFGRGYNLEITVSRLEPCALHFEDRVIKMVQFEFVCGLGIYFFYCHSCLWLVCKNQASDSLITPRFLTNDSPTPTPALPFYFYLFLLARIGSDPPLFFLLS